MSHYQSRDPGTGRLLAEMFRMSGSQTKRGIDMTCRDENEATADPITMDCRSPIVGEDTHAERSNATLIAFRDGSYKKVRPVEWKHSQWIHYTLKDGSVVHVNPANVNYLHTGAD